MRGDVTHKRHNVILFCRAINDFVSHSHTKSHRVNTYILFTVDKSSAPCRTLNHAKLRIQYVINGAPQIELSSYSFSKYMKFVADVDLASSHLHKSHREIGKVSA